MPSLKADLVLSPYMPLPEFPVFIDVVYSRHPQSSWIKWRQWNICFPGALHVLSIHSERAIFYSMDGDHEPMAFISIPLRGKDNTWAIF